MRLPSSLKCIASLLIGTMTAWTLVTFAPAQAATCTPLPLDAVHWWRAEGDAQDSVGTSHGALVGNVAFSPGTVGQGFSFDGTGYVTIPDDPSLDLTGALTVEFWFYETNPSAFRGIIGKRQEPGTLTSNYGVNVLVISSPHGIGLYYNDPAVAGGDDFEAVGSPFETIRAPVPPLQQFHHFAGTYRQTDPATIELSLYLDGALARTRTLPGNLENTLNDAPLTIGASFPGAELFAGIIDEITLYARALTAQEIAAIYEASDAGKCAPSSNHAPTLSFSSENGYGTDGVNPDKGTANLTPLAFKAVYTDQDNDPPQNLSLHIDTGTVNLDPIPLVPDTDSTVPASLRDGNYTNGEQYAHTATFPKGQYQYHFESSDGEATTRLPAAGELAFQTGYSNVAFLPGFLGSRLYQYDYDCLLVNCENQLWDPNVPYLTDVQKLYLDTNGNPVYPDIYTKHRDVIDESLQSPKWPGSNVYKKFIEFMDNELAGNVINVWEPVSYDWRLPLETTVNGGIQRPANTFADLAQTIEDLAADSANGKVTLIGHSNGGLLAKVLVNRLNTEGKASLVDRLIMVGTPQLGTPDVIEKLLHGQGPSDETTREFLENMVSAYNFLPSPVYFQRVASPVIEFDPEVSNIYNFLGIYEESINTVGEFTAFLLGDNGLRTEPPAGDTDAPNVLRENLLAQAQATHAALDLWVPPAGIEVIQIAGWGEQTKRGIRYDDCDIPFCSQTLSHLDRAPLKVEDGDGTVVIPSAAAMDASSYPVYYLNLNDHNDDNFINLKHADILEVEELQNLIQQIVQNSLDLNNLPNYFSTIKPEPESEDDRLQIRGLSPISIDVYDSKGFHTGPVPNPDPSADLQFFEENIPNSDYEKVGEKTYIGLDAHNDYRIEIKGLALGSFTLEIDELFNNEVTGSIAYTNIPVTPTTKAFLTTQTIDNTSSLTLDVQGDGIPDVAISPSETPDPKASLKALKQVVNTLVIQKGVKNAIIKQIEAAELVLNKRLPKIADGVLKGLARQLQNFPKFLINPSDAQALIQIIETIRLSLVQ